MMPRPTLLGSYSQQPTQKGATAGRLVMDTKGVSQVCQAPQPRAVIRWVQIDGLTGVPEDLYRRLLRAADRAKNRGQHCLFEEEVAPPVTALGASSQRPVHQQAARRAATKQRLVHLPIAPRVA